MQAIPTSIPDVLIIESKVFGDARGFFYESINAKRFAEKTGISTPFVQDNHSRSARHVLRGLHYQIQQPQGKLVRQYDDKLKDKPLSIHPIATHEYPVPAKRPTNSSLSTEKIRKTFGLELPNWEDELAECVRLLYV